MPRKNHGLFVGDSILSDDVIRLYRIAQHTPVTWPEAQRFATEAKEQFDKLDRFPRLLVSFNHRTTYRRRGCYLWDGRIVLYPLGQNLASLCHEVAHGLTLRRGHCRIWAENLRLVLKSALTTCSWEEDI